MTTMRELMMIVENTWQFIFESKVKRVTAETGQPFVIIENPSPVQLKSLISDEWGCKGMLSPDGHRILVWNAYFAEHYVGWNLWHGLPLRLRASGDLEVDDAAKAQIGLGITEDEVYSDAASIVEFKDAPAVRRMFNKPFKVSDGIITEIVE